ncbi:ABC transporter substrate-binding protein [Methylobacterium dankookense]|uniref:Leucine-, isoleucine-, valine-, threonine-, and alanine-binding protein n=1 Tax=Methylobacterium dankookense TaxID=560405 RepID=A0A564G098_9HYPH|nr:ABC transporter substrate-binding protein [Methylobacterium dankookense]GJD57437.1 Leucine-, isoleucine-, valine-, threonine-, and alanine-binding protein [Methylobacterium dankookense]VUF13899.1 Leucine-, isoleucine-, valine-, threonine-, and alanine-binding protein [Methylobacterium dankookense]
MPARFTLTTAILLALTVTGARADAIRIGVNEPLTGPFAASGTYVVNGARIAADEINAKGGVLGRKIELVIEDNKSNPTEAAAVAEKLITSDKTPVMMGAWGSSLTLAVMPKLADYEVPMLVETSSSGKITTSGNPFVFRISPPSALEAETFAPMVAKLGLKKVDFLVLNNDFGRGAAADFGKMLKDKGVQVGMVETMDQGAQDMSAQLAKLKASDSDTIMITSAVDQLVLLFKQMAALGMKKRVITTGGSQNPDQIIAQAGSAADGTLHLTTFLPWIPEKTPNPTATAYFIGEWKKRGFEFAGVTESFRGYDGIRTIAQAIEKAGKAESAAITKALWSVDFTGLNGPIRFAKSGPAGKESGQSKPDVYLIEIKDGRVVVPTL